MLSYNVSVHTLDRILLFLLQVTTTQVYCILSKLLSTSKKVLLQLYLNALAGAQSIPFKRIENLEATMATFVSQINDRLSMLEKRMDKIDPFPFDANKHTHYSSPENAGT